MTEEVMGSSAAMAEPSSDGASVTGSRRRTTKNARSYGDDVLTDRQPRITDLVPRRYSILFVGLFAGLTVVAGLEAAYLYLPQWAAVTSDGQLAAVDLEAEGSLANWFSSMTLALAAVVAAIIFSLRRHRQDDYHGRYRVWLWAALLWMTMSVDESASLHEGFKELASHFSGQRGYGDGSIWWIAGYGLVFAALGTRLFLEMRCCRLSSTALVAGVGCYVAAVAAKIGVVPELHGTYAVMAEEGCEMLGNVLLLFSMATHARYTILDAQGALSTKAKKAAKAKSEKDAAAEPRKEPSSKSQAAAEPVKRSWFGGTTVDAAHAAPPAPAAKTLESSKAGGKSASKPAAHRATADEGGSATRTARKQPAGSAEDDDDFETDRRLSKAERKALRRQQDRPRPGE
ncbi:MAG: hypothetical protein B7Z73_09375 [Planctomycetia bacterium 21-64-5]|nr:MAG: hypothetical protein B7Z73_09375 [Planctomycetia bacterium 21-64-5]